MKNITITNNDLNLLIKSAAAATNFSEADVRSQYNSAVEYINGIAAEIMTNLDNLTNDAAVIKTGLDINIIGNIIRNLGKIVESFKQYFDPKQGAPRQDAIGYINGLIANVYEQFDAVLRWTADQPDSPIMEKIVTTFNDAYVSVDSSIKTSIDNQSHTALQVYGKNKQEPEGSSSQPKQEEPFNPDSQVVYGVATLIENYPDARGEIQKILNKYNIPGF